MVSGPAIVRNSLEIYMLHKNKSTFIPSDIVHCLERPGLVELKLIDGYLGEDDIVRFEVNMGEDS